MNRQRGFTLIELLVVIAIIGLLAGIVLVSLSGARDSAKDARIITSMGQFRSTAEIVNANDSDYANVGEGNANYDFAALLDDMTAQGALGVRTGAAATGYCAEVMLNNNEYYCVDATNFRSWKTASVSCTDAAADANHLECN